MTPTRILVTGATGFIGSRLCELLSLEHHLPYRALVRDFSRAARIGRLDVELVAGDMLDAASLARAVEGCDAVVNLAHSDDKTAAKQTAPARKHSSSAASVMAGLSCEFSARRSTGSRARTGSFNP